MSSVYNPETLMPLKTFFLQKNPLIIRQTQSTHKPIQTVVVQDTIRNTQSCSVLQTEAQEINLEEENHTQGYTAQLSPNSVQGTAVYPEYLPLKRCQLPELPR